LSPGVRRGQGSTRGSVRRPRQPGLRPWPRRAPGGAAHSRCPPV